ncbi:hypothetical protein EI94DRAFT_1705633 [Lactarius quietus]|nr:hypothetical protein EI94DRAFT_1705633 [Lactarius quietus]
MFGRLFGRLSRSWRCPPSWRLIDKSLTRVDQHSLVLCAYSHSAKTTQPPASVSMPQTPETAPSSSNIERIFDAALKSYNKKTKKDIKNHDLFKQLETCDSPASILSVFQAAQFEAGSDDRLRKWLVPTINVLCAFSDALGEGVFSPAKVVFAGAGVLLLAAKDVVATQDTLIDTFGRIESFFVRLEIYTGVPLTQAMTDKMVQITVEVLDILATATKEMEQSRATNIWSEKFLKRVAGRTDLEDGLKKLSKLTDEEIAMATVQILKVTHNIDKKVTGVDKGVKSVDENVLVVKSGVQLINDNVKAVDDKVQTMADAGKTTTEEVKLVLQQTAHGVANMKSL